MEASVAQSKERHKHGKKKKKHSKKSVKKEEDPKTKERTVELGFEIVSATVKGERTQDLTEQLRSLSNSFWSGHGLFLPEKRWRELIPGASKNSRQFPTLSISFRHLNKEVQTLEFTDSDHIWLGGAARDPPLTRVEKMELLQKYKPCLWLHPNETSWPARVEWYFARTSLWIALDGGEKVQILPRIDDPSVLSTVTYKHGEKVYRTSDERRFFLKINNLSETRGGEGRDGRNGVPFYVNVAETPAGELDLNYFFFYAYNGAILHGPGSGGLAALALPSIITASAGVHEGDWEMVTVRLSPDGSQVRAVYMSRHSTDECRWYLRPATSENADDGWHMVDGTHPRIYVARESHANYNLPGRQRRGHGGLVDDYTGIGDVWFPPELVLLDDPPVPWLGYRGNWGRPKEGRFESGGPTGPPSKSPFHGRHLLFLPSNTIPKVSDAYYRFLSAHDAELEKCGRLRIVRYEGAKQPLKPSNISTSSPAILTNIASPSLSLTVPARSSALPSGPTPSPSPDSCPPFVSEFRGTVPRDNHVQYV